MYFLLYLIFLKSWILCDELLSLPLRYYAVMVTMFFTVSVVNNYALNLNIAMPLHMIFRSVSLPAHVNLYLWKMQQSGSIKHMTKVERAYKE